MVTLQADTPFVRLPLELADPDDDEVRVRIVGVGLCHTDLVAQQGGIAGLTFPAVFGHEGAGVVEAVGAGVRKVSVGDRVALTFLSCGACASCAHDSPAYCEHFPALNFGGRRRDGRPTLHLDGEPVSGHFFGQSTFASHALVSERNLVRVPPGIPLEIAGVLGCGVQTGAGAVLRSLDCAAGSTLLVLGGGAVGLSAVMAARVRGLSRIVVFEPHASRRALALELGATDVLDPAAGELADAVLAVLPQGLDSVLDTTGLPPLIAQVPRVLARRGSFGFVGVPPAGHGDMGLPGTLMDAMRRGLTLRGIIEGDSNLDPFIETLMQWYLAGQFPFDRLVHTFALSDINAAIAAQHRGGCVKAVLLA